MAPGLALAAASLGSQNDLAWAFPSPATEAAICRLLFSLFWVGLGIKQLATDLGPHLPGGLRGSTPNGQFQTMLKYDYLTTSTSDALKGWPLSGHQTLLK